MKKVLTYMNTEDDALLVREILDQGYIIIPDIEYSKPIFEKLSTFKKYYDFRCSSPIESMFIAYQPNKLQSEFKFMVINNQPQNRSWYNIIPRVGGPCLLLSFPRAYNKGHSVFLPPGQLGYNTSFMDSNSEKIVQISREAGLDYNRLIQGIKRRFKKEFVRGSVYYIGPGADSDRKCGKVLLS